MKKRPTEKEIDTIFNNYLKDCQDDKVLPTKNGIMLKLKIYNRDTYNRWKKDSDALKKTEMIIEDCWTYGIASKNYDTAGCIFYLKNAFGWRDRQDHDITSGGKPIPLLDYTKKK